jgi:Fe-S-cluster containining protein
MADDTKLIQIVDAALAEAASRAGAWLTCRPGCYECCLGPFEISALDAQRLREGMRDLETRDPGRAARIRARASEVAARWRQEYPGDTVNRVLSEAEDDEPCPVLDPATGTCDLYESRPLACRTFGPAIRSGGAVGVCELCFPGATEEQIAACAVELDAEALEAHFLQEQGEASHEPTLVAMALG